MLLWQRAIACLLQGTTALHLAAGAGRVAVLETLLLNGADPKARDTKWVTYSSCICIFGTDTAHIACRELMLIDTFLCGKCHIHVSCLVWYTGVHTFVATMLAMTWLLTAEAIVTLWPPALTCLLQGRTALHLAATAGQVAVVETLLLDGANPEAREKWVSCSS